MCSIRVILLVTSIDIVMSYYVMEMFLWQYEFSHSTLYINLRIRQPVFSHFFLPNPLFIWPIYFPPSSSTHDHPPIPSLEFGLYTIFEWYTYLQTGLCRVWYLEPETWKVAKFQSYRIDWGGVVWGAQKRPKTWQVPAHAQCCLVLVIHKDKKFIIYPKFFFIAVVYQDKYSGKPKREDR